MNNSLTALYYPFSRCLDICTLKQLLLVFDSVTFLDAVLDDQWRAHLMKEMALYGDQKHEGYQEVHDALDLLKKQSALRILDPSHYVNQQTLITQSAISDLFDSSWCNIASRPKEFNMPFRQLTDCDLSAWEIFKPKLPDSFVEALESDEKLRKHIISHGTDYRSWLLSYEAGSAITTSFHLAVADNYNCAPVTDSLLHHKLLCLKAWRNCDVNADASMKKTVSPKVVSQIANQTLFSAVQDLLPRSVLLNARFEDIINFRNKTLNDRQNMVDEVGKELNQSIEVCDPEKLFEIQSDIFNSLMGKFEEYQNGLASVRDKIWPQLVGSINKSLVPAGIAAVGMNYIGGAGQALVGSIVAASISILQESLELRAEEKKLVRNSGPAVAYLSKIKSFK